MYLLLIVLCYPLLISSEALPYAEWAHYHMIWISNDRSNETTVQSMFDNYNNHQIRFGSLNIDSCWASNFNTFIFNSTLFPNVREMLDRFRLNGTHIILWMTSFINIDSPNYQYGQDHGFLFNKTLKWWHGEGRLLNYLNSQALNWWNNQIKNLIETVGPIHAFKADASDPYIQQVNDSHVTWEEYRTAYYNNTFEILRQLVGPEALIMSRPVDNDEKYSPREVVFMGWVGDEHGNYDGLKKGLRYMLESGRDGYVGFGSDIGGFISDSASGSLGRTKEVFLRWTAVGALSSFMENGGQGEHFPWNFDDETTNIYRQWVDLHYQLIPYLYSQGTKVAIGRNGTLMKPCDDIEVGSSQSYFLGPNIYVVPIPHDPIPDQLETIWLPQSSTQQWIDYFNTSIIHQSQTFIKQDTTRLDRIPLYIEQNSLIPMYHLEQSSSLNAFKFILWGNIIIEKQIRTTLFTRDGQQWLIIFNSKEKQLTVQFIQEYYSIKKEQWIWKFCQYANQQQICSEDWIQLDHNASIQLHSLI